MTDEEWTSEQGLGERLSTADNNAVFDAEAMQVGVITLSRV
jgi:hypothetical protein